MAISSPGIGSNLDVNSILKQLMTVEAQPLQALDKKEAAYQAKLSAFGNLKGALGTFQTSLATLNSASKFQNLAATPGDTSILKATATGQAAAGSYNVTVSQMAQAQTIMTAGQSSTTGAIGTGTLVFQFGTVSGGSFVSASNKLSTAVASGGIAPNSLTINGTPVTTSATTNSAQALAAQINLQSGSTGVTATAAATDTGAAATGALGALGAFATIVPGAGSYSLSVGGVPILSNSNAATTAASLDAALVAAAPALTAAGIAYTGTVGGTGAAALRFTRADGSNIAVTETLTGGATGGFTTTTSGGTKTFTSSISLSSSGPINVGGSNPSLSGLTPGLLPNTYSGATFIQDPNQSTGTVTIDSSNNTLQGIRDAINKANVGVTASIVSDGSASPNRLVLTSTKTGATSSMKITVSGDAALSDLLTQDPAGTQKMTQSVVGQSTLLTVNGISVSSATNTIADAIQGVTLNVSKVGTTTLSVARDSAPITKGVNDLIKAYNELDKTLKDLTGYNASTKTGGALLGDATARSVQTNIRQMLTTSINEGTKIKTLSDIGVAIQKDGTLSLASASKLQDAINNNINELGGLFTAFGTTTDGLISFAGSGANSKPGTYEVKITTAATQGKTVGSIPAGLTVNAGVNDQLSLLIDGVSASVTLPGGTYDINSLTSQIQSTINGVSSLASAGISVKVTADASNAITIQSNRYGSKSEVTISGNGAINLLGTQTKTSGVDVVGTIGGIAGVGSGQTLTGAGGSPADGIKLLVTGTGTGSRGAVTFSQGIAYQMDKLLAGFLGDQGMITDRTKGIDSSIKDLDKRRETINSRLAATEKRLRAQFTALDKVVSGLTKTSNFLTQQLANLPKIE